jgi:hypothetical protein
MSAINISVFGDTIYVANGVYEEQVVMIQGLSLIGAGMDSCVIYFQDLGIAVEVVDSCIFKGFKIIVENNLSTIGIDVKGNNNLVTLNKIVNSSQGIYISYSNSIIDKNIFDNIRTRGINIFNANGVIKNNIVYMNMNSTVAEGLHLEAFDYSYSLLIDSNHIETVGDGIRQSFGTRPIISNNTIILKRVGAAVGVFLGTSDSAKVFNNLIFAEGGRNGINNAGVQYLQLYNNYLTGNFDDPQDLAFVLHVGPDNVVKNNVITNAERGVNKFSGQPDPIFQYNNVWNNDVNYSGFTPDSTNISVDPMIVNEDTTLGDLDFHLQMFSPLIDAGDPNILDVDGSRSDIGLYGGPLGERYSYQDLAPKPPRNLSAVVDSEYITISWIPNTEADFSQYNLYRDTTANFTADSTTFVLSLSDTFYSHLIPDGIDAFYYKLTATDNQGNESGPSEELAVIITSIKEYPSTVSNYQLYQNFPNPFNPSTKIAYKLKERGYVKLYVYDVKGELVSIMVNQFQEAGYYEVEFSGEKQEVRGKSLAEKLASGIYIYQIMIKSEKNIPVFSDMKKMILLK